MPTSNSEGREKSVGTAGSLASNNSRPLSHCSGVRVPTKSWQLTADQLKRYRHFDGYISCQDAIRLATDKERVSKHAFYPFLRYTKSYNKFAAKGEPGRKKERPIRFAARRDAYIFMYYRWLLAGLYEKQLQARGLTQNVLAYRSIPDDCAAGTSKSLCKPRVKTHKKTTIHLARDCFAKIREMAGNSDVLVFGFDIESFFENLDHSRVKSIWEKILGVDRLPSDHFRVFKAVTRYAYVDLREFLRRVGPRGGSKQTAINSKASARRGAGLRLCSGKELRVLIKREPDLIHQNTDKGVPQGCPMSDLISNMYMLDFDCAMVSLMKHIKGAYFRYADDILLIVPDTDNALLRIPPIIAHYLRTQSYGLNIKSEKTTIHRFKTRNGKCVCEFVKGEHGKNGLEYLGFRFDGQNVYIRDSTMSGYYRKMTFAVRAAVRRWRTKYPNASSEECWQNFPRERLYQKFGRVEDWDDKIKGYKNWTFYSYANRAHALMESIGSRISNQIVRHRKHFINKLQREIFGPK